MQVDLDRQDLIHLIKGTNGPSRYVHPFNYLGRLTGFPNERWEWNETTLNTMDEFQLHYTYFKLKEFINATT